MSHQSIKDAALDAAFLLPELSTMLCAIAKRNLEETSADYAATLLVSRELDRLAREINQAPIGSQEGAQPHAAPLSDCDELHRVHHDLVMLYPGLATLAESLEREVLELAPGDTWGCAAIARALHAQLKASTDRLELALDPK